jgi:hypothetical protein
MIICHPKTQLLTTLPMWQGGPLSLFFYYKKKKKKKKRRRRRRRRKE